MVRLQTFAEQFRVVREALQQCVRLLGCHVLTSRMPDHAAGLLIGSKVGEDGLGVAALEGGGEALQAVVVRCCLFFLRGENGGEAMEEVEDWFAEAGMHHKDYGCHGLRVVFVAFLELT